MLIYFLNNNKKIKNFSILWQKECGESTNCLLYDTDSLRLFLFFKLISFSLIIFKKIIRHVISLYLSESGFRCILIFPFEHFFRVSLMLTTGFIMLIGVFFDVGVWYYSKSLVIFGEDEDDETTKEKAATNDGAENDAAKKFDQVSFLAP